MKVQKNWQNIVRVVSIVAYILSWLGFSTGFVMYYPMLSHIHRLQIMSSAGAMIILPMLAFSIPGLAIGILLVFHIISRRKNRRHVYMALIMFFSLPYLTGAGVTVFMASAFLGLIQHGSTTANGVPIVWVSLVLFSCVTSTTSYWISVILVALSNVKNAIYRSQELLQTSEYQPLLHSS